MLTRQADARIALTICLAAVDMKPKSSPTVSHFTPRSIHCLCAAGPPPTDTLGQYIRGVKPRWTLS
jgi:hypothetical protein